MQDLPTGLKYTIIGMLGFWVLFNLALYGSIFYGSFHRKPGRRLHINLQKLCDVIRTRLKRWAWPSLINTFNLCRNCRTIDRTFGLLIAYIVVRKDFQGQKSLEFLTMLCFAVPGTVAGGVLYFSL